MKDVVDLIKGVALMTLGLVGCSAEYTEYTEEDDLGTLEQAATLIISDTYGYCDCGTLNQSCVYNNRSNSKRCYVPDRLPVRIRLQDASGLPAFATQPIRDGLTDAINYYYSTMNEQIPFVWVSSGEDILFRIVDDHGRAEIPRMYVGPTTECHTPAPYGQRCSVEKFTIEFSYEDYMYELPVNPFAPRTGCYTDGTTAMQGARHIAKYVWLHEIGHAMGLSHIEGPLPRIMVPLINSYRCTGQFMSIPLCGPSQICGDKYAELLNPVFSNQEKNDTLNFFVLNGGTVLPE